MDEQDLKWLEAIAESGVSEHVRIIEPQIPVCCCAAPFEVDGVRYESRDAGCLFHGLRSRWIPQPGNTLKAKRNDGKRHCGTGADRGE